MNTQADEEKKYPKPALTADVVVLALGPGGLQVLLIRRRSDPYRGRWALPGGFCEPHESIEEAAARELQEETGLAGVRVEQVYAFTAPGRDPRGWVVSVAHIALIPAPRVAEVKAGDDADDARWWTLSPVGEGEGTRERGGPTGAGAYVLRTDGERAGPLAFDHDAILAKALARLHRDVDTLSTELLGGSFTAADLARARAAILALGGAPAPEGG